MLKRNYIQRDTKYNPERLIKRNTLYSVLNKYNMRHIIPFLLTILLITTDLESAFCFNENISKENAEYSISGNIFNPNFIFSINKKITRHLLYNGQLIRKSHNWKFIIASNKDLYIIKKQGTPHRLTEVHVLSAASNYTRFIFQIFTCLHETDEDWDFALGSNNDLYAIKKKGVNSTEIHVLSRASNYQAFTLQTAIPLEKTDSNSAFGIGTNNDLYIIKQQGVNSTEMHVLSRASNYQIFTLHTATPLEKTGVNWAFGIGTNNDLYIIKQQGVNSTEIHVLSRASNYQAFTLQTATHLEKTDVNWAFGIGTNNDLYIIKQQGVNSTEMHLLSRASNYQSFTLHTGTALAKTSDAEGIPLVPNFKFAATADPQYNGENREYYAQTDLLLSYLGNKIGAGKEYQGLIIAGDLTQFTQKGEIKEFYKNFVDGVHPNNQTEIGEGGSLGSVAKMVNASQKCTYLYEGLGNHDYSDGGCCAGFADRYNCECPDELYKMVDRDNRNSQCYGNGLNYSWDWQGVHFIQLNLRPSDNTDGDPSLNPYRALTFLKKDLQRWAGSNRPVIIIHHYGFDDFSGSVDANSKTKQPWWTINQKNEYWDAIASYNVIALITGHCHTPVSALQKWSRPVGKSNGPASINTFIAGGAWLGYWIEFEINDHQMIVTPKTTSSSKPTIDRMTPIKIPIKLYGE